MAHYLYNPESADQAANLELVTLDEKDYRAAIGEILKYAMVIYDDCVVSLDDIREVLDADPKSLPLEIFNRLLTPNQTVVSGDYGLDINIHEGEYTIGANGEVVDELAPWAFSIDDPLNVREGDQDDPHLIRQARNSELTHYGLQRIVLFNEDGSSEVVGDDEHASLGHIDYETGQFVPRQTVLNMDHPVRQLIQEQGEQARPILQRVA